MALLVVTVWPIGDLASSVSLTAATVQRLVIMVLVAPLLLMATPTERARPTDATAAVDAVTRVLAHPGVAMVVVTVLGTVTLIYAGRRLGRAFFARARRWFSSWSSFVGLVLWLPALGVLPGAKRLSPVGARGLRLRVVARRDEPLVRVDLLAPLALSGAAPPTRAVAHDATLRPAARRLRRQVRLLHPDVGGRVHDLLSRRRAGNAHRRDAAALGRRRTTALAHRSPARASASSSSNAE